MYYKIAAEFLKSTGVPVEQAHLAEPVFLPGLTIRDGVILVDEVKLLYPGDLLHEAGHLAMLPPAERAVASAPLDPGPGLEMAAIAWSYAAAVHLNLPLEVLFHPDGYKGDSQTLIENFSQGCYIGVPMLEWAGLTLTGERARKAGIESYPRMRRWLRE